jgi:glyceraldehyde-3-phosphate dehydrogenase (NAD(P))
LKGRNPGRRIVEDMLKKADIVVDATPGGIGETNKPLYEKAGVKAIWQGGEEHEVAGFSFNAHANYKDAIGRQFVRLSLATRPVYAG